MTRKLVSKDTWLLYLSMVLCHNVFLNIFYSNVRNVVVKGLSLIFYLFASSFLLIIGLLLLQAFHVLRTLGVNVQMISQGASKVSHLNHDFLCRSFLVCNAHTRLVSTSHAHYIPSKVPEAALNGGVWL